MYREIEKVLITMDEFRETIHLQKTLQQVSAAKIRWLQYTTKANGGNVLSIECTSIGNAGFVPKSNGANAKYLLAVPIDSAYPVTCMYGNSTDTYDIVLDVPKEIISLDFEIKINGEIASTLIDVNYPVIFEIAFYRRL